jgi:uncharacterized protein (TIGR02145 family)
MKLSTLICIIFSLKLCFGQTNLNVQMNNGSSFQIPNIEIDSVTYSPPNDALTDYLNSILSYGTVVHQDGQIYYTVAIGGQEWMAENLRTSVYSNGDMISYLKGLWSWQNCTHPVWTHYGNVDLYEYPFGRLYNYYTVIDSRNVCPTGWHVPDTNDWNILIGNIDSAFDPTAPNGILSNTAGSQLKSTSDLYWMQNNADATNSTGFSAIAGGGTSLQNPLWIGMGFSASFWTSTPVYNVSTKAYLIGFGSSNGDVYLSEPSKENGFAIRCLKD